jgi:ATP-dependent exoDNAse (exonuclease V) alpha subunit
VARDYEILTEALRHGRGRIDANELKGAMAAREMSGALLREGDEVATLGSLDREREMVATVNRGMGAFEPIGGGREFIASDLLNPQQRKAVEFVLSSRDLVVAISGAAGTGKTATLRELKRGLIDAGREVVALAPTMSAVLELQAVGFAKAVTVERMLQDQQLQVSLGNRVIVLDEAGMVSGRQMSELLRIAQQSGARLVFSGDTRQIQSVEAGDALRILETESRLKSTALREVQRQTDRAYRTAIEELRRDPENGFRELEKIGAVHEVAWDRRAAFVADVWERANAEPSGSGTSVLVVCATHNEIANVTDAIRAKRRATGELGESYQVAQEVALGWTTAQKADSRNYRAGLVLGFHREVKGISRNTTVEVLRTDDKGIVVKCPNGGERRITRKQAQSFDVLNGDRLK